MRTIQYEKIVDEVARLCMESNYYLDQDIRDVLQKSLEQEISPTGQDVLKQILDNAEIAANEQVPMCQDTGVAVVFLEVGQELMISGGLISDAVTEGVIRGYREGFLRTSMCDPFTRKNTGNNAPPVIHTEIVPGDKLKITVAPKGGGSENMSAIKMLPPSAGIPGIRQFVLERIKEAGPNPCPPVIVGIGIGGNFEKCALLAKKALLRRMGEASPLPEVAALEKELLEKINELGIGPAGYGGKTTALNVAIEYYPCHIASLPVAININCHAARHQSVII